MGRGRRGSPDIIKLLLPEGSLVNIKGSPDTCKPLLRKGSRLNIKGSPVNIAPGILAQGSKARGTKGSSRNLAERRKNPVRAGKYRVEVVKLEDSACDPGGRQFEAGLSTLF